MNDTGHRYVLSRQAGNVCKLLDWSWG